MDKWQTAIGVLSTAVGKEMTLAKSLDEIWGNVAAAAVAGFIQPGIFNPLIAALKLYLCTIQNLIFLFFFPLGFRYRTAAAAVAAAGRTFERF